MYLKYIGNRIPKYLTGIQQLPLFLTKRIYIWSCIYSCQKTCSCSPFSTVWSWNSFLGSNHLISWPFHSVLSTGPLNISLLPPVGHAVPHFCLLLCPPSPRPGNSNTSPTTCLHGTFTGETWGLSLAVSSVFPVPQGCGTERRLSRKHCLQVRVPSWLRAPLWYFCLLDTLSTRTGHFSVE